VQDQRVPVGVAEERHVAETGVVHVGELDAPRLEPRLRGRDVGDSQRDRLAVTARDALGPRLDERDRDVRGLELGEIPRVLGQPQRVAVERRRALAVTRRNVDEVDALDELDLLQGISKRSLAA